MSQLQPVRGTRDLLPADCRKFRALAKTALALAELFGFEEMETPILESSALFKRSLGDSSDIVTKQMYAFLDNGGDELVLRPEGTAGIARAFISEGLSQLAPLKLFYQGPMFRYERPQRGRYRQFYQIGVEVLGVEKPQADIEVLDLAYQILSSLHLKGSIVLHLNTIGDAESRAAYRERLVAYLNTRKSALSKESLLRLERNPLRILDSKDEGDRAAIAGAPVLDDALNDRSRRFFDAVKAGLELLEIPYVVDPLLVRGLDYYCHTVFEFTSNALGSQNAVLSGGRYDGLIKDLGGPQTPGVGWAAGMDRLAEMLELPEPKLRPIALLPIGDEAEGQCLRLAHRLRKSGIFVDMGFSGNMQKRMKRASKIRSSHAVIIGPDELRNRIAQVKDLDTGEQTEVGFETLASYFAGNV